jgi:CBS domain-containing protein
MTLVREAMMPDPKALPADASAQEAGELLSRPEVRAVLVVDGDRLVGVVTADALVEQVVAAGRDPRSTPVGAVANAVAVTAAPDMPVEDAYHLMEAGDIERLPVTEEGRLVGVLSRSALSRRLAEDEPPTADPELAQK